MNKDSAKTPCLGIMGGGQLGLYLCQAASKLGIRTAVMEPNPKGSAIHAADTALVAGLDDLAALQKLIDVSDVITFELEAIPDASLQLLNEAQQLGAVRVHPGVETLALFKDKGVQKAWLKREGLPTLPSLPVINGALPREVITGEWSLPVVQKAHRGGYDGKGVQLLRTTADLEKLWNVPSYLEPALEPCREIGVVVARDLGGELLAYPPVSMKFDDRYNAVHSVTSPGNLQPQLTQAALDLALAAVGKISTPGVYAVELFVANETSVTINEISPRVHNSGHLTMEGFMHSQFEQHVRAVMGLRLAPVEATAPVAVMLNLLYEDGLEPVCPAQPLDLRLDGKAPVTVHWYGKSTGQAGRKMGHLTAVGADRETVTAAAEQTLNMLREGQQTGLQPVHKEKTS